MSIVIAAAVLAVVSTSDGDSADIAAATQSEEVSPTDGAVPTAAQDAKSLKRAETFIAAVDAGDWTQSWNAAGEFFQTQTSAAEWASLVDPVRSPLGEVEQRTLISVQQASTLPGAPEGDYEVLQFQTKFADRDELAVETVIMIRNGRTFDVAGFFIR